MKSIMRGRERRRKRKIVIVVTVIAVPVIAVGVWLLLFNNGGGKPAAVNEPSAAPSVSTAAPSETPAQSVLGEATVIPQISVDPNDWRLILVSAKHSLPEGFKVTLTTLKSGQSVDERCYPDLQKMMDDCRKEGLKPFICSSYRTKEKQQQLFDNKVKKLKQQGLSDEEAKVQAATVIAVPGTSEHQTGLALDIASEDNQNLDESQESTPVQQWLSKNCWKYGFIIRYPATKSETTGITYEPWHYRYVGKEAAQFIYEHGLCLEDYLSQVS
jgi:zinc D-Ala-D-Ala carboxypeptidase